MNIGLINFNKRGVIEENIPPVPPIGLEYLADDLLEKGHFVELLDLCFVPIDALNEKIRIFIEDKDVIGITFRNIDSGCYILKKQFFVPDLKVIVDIIKTIKNIPVVLGGAGYSNYPEEILQFVGADFGIAGSGEIAFCNLIQNLDKLPHGSVITSPPNTSIVHKRDFIDYDKYIAAGGVPAIQTKLGCIFSCNFCIEANSPVYIRNLDAVIDELKILLSRGIKFIHIADSEFNMDISHAESFCDRILDEGLEFSWSTYLTPKPMTENLVKKMKAAGCVKPCVGIDSGDDTVLKTQNKKYRIEHVRQMALWFHETELPFTADLLFGCVGDNLETAKHTIELMEDIEPEIIGMNLGVRIYKNTEIWRQVVANKIPIAGKLYGQLENNNDFLYPVFYIFDMNVLGYLMRLCAKDSKYMLYGYKSFGGVNYTLAQ